jgi:hypothetical protein
MPKIDRAELERSWAATARHLKAARDLLSGSLRPGVDGASLGGFEECLKQHEMQLALDELEDVGLSNAPAGEFWRHLQYAAESMALSDRAADFKRKADAA